MYRLTHVSWSGCNGLPTLIETRTDARGECARRLRSYRRNGFPVSTLERGRQWEIGEPNNVALVPSQCGTLLLRAVTFECRECGSKCDTRETAAQCCSPDYCEEGE